MFEKQFGSVQPSGLSENKVSELLLSKRSLRSVTSSGLKWREPALKRSEMDSKAIGVRGSLEAHTGEGGGCGGNGK